MKGEVSTRRVTKGLPRSYLYHKWAPLFRTKPKETTTSHLRLILLLLTWFLFSSLLYIEVDEASLSPFDIGVTQASFLHPRRLCWENDVEQKQHLVDTAHSTSVTSYGSIGDASKSSPPKQKHPFKPRTRDFVIIICRRNREVSRTAVDPQARARACYSPATM